jgi:hypothetical protein
MSGSARRAFCCIAREDRLVDRPPSRTLQRALEFVGDHDELAEKLAISRPELEDYLAGRKPIPNEVFLAALDVVAGK